MDAQQPAEGILIHKDYGDAKFYTVTCDCGNPDDEIRLEVEAEDTGISVHVWTTVKTKWWDDAWRKRYDIENEFLQDLHWLGLDFLNGLANRLKLTWKLWTKGYLEHESWTILTRQQALNFSETLKKAIEDVNEFRQEKKSD